MPFEPLIKECKKSLGCEMEEDCYGIDKPSVGGVIEAGFKGDLRLWLDTIIITEDDVFLTDNTMVVTARGNFTMNNNLCASITREHHKDNLEMLYK